MTGGRPSSFSRLISGGNRSPRSIGGMRRGQDSPADTSLKRSRLAGEPWNGRKDVKVSLIIKAFIPGLKPGLLLFCSAKSTEQKVRVRLWLMYNQRILYCTFYGFNDQPCRLINLIFGGRPSKAQANSPHSHFPCNAHGTEHV